MLKGGLGDFIGLHYTDTTIGEIRQQPNGCLLWTVRGNWPATGCRVNRQPCILTGVCSRRRGVLSLTCRYSVAVETLLFAIPSFDG